MPKPARSLHCLLLIFLLCTLKTTAQKTGGFKTRHTLYAEAATQGPVYSINYDRIFSQGRVFAKTYQLGFSVYREVLAFPVGIHFITGKTAHHTELGLTVIPYIEKYQKLFAAGNLSDKKMYLVPGAGYRYQQPGGGFFCKVIAAPVLYLDPPSDNFWKMDPKLFGGITVGAGFSF